jgi:alpha-1,2-mannosyltransferase
VCCLVRFQGSFNNDDAVSKSAVLTWAKVVYYRVFARLYGAVGSISEVVLVNSSWTHGHIASLWRVPAITTIVYPPCNTADLEKNPLDGRAEKVVSVAQYRPEKNHGLQLRAFGRFLAECPQYAGRVELVMLGGCRNDGDRARVEALNLLRTELGLEGSVTILTNVPYPDLKRHLGEALVGIHTMKDEHFGISVVEFMAAGVIPLAHNSAGPRMDIVTPSEDGGKPTGRLADTEEGYAAALRDIFALGPPERVALQQRARRAVQHRFSDDAFSSAFLAGVAPLFTARA